MATRMLQRRGTAAEWAAENPILASGEIGFETDTKMMKMGDGVTPWNSLTLPYVQTGGGTMTGALSLIAPTADAHAARLQDVGDVAAQAGLQDILYITASTTFVAANYPWLRMLRAFVIGGGGGGGGAGNTTEYFGATGGGGGSTAIVSLTPAQLSASETLTVGAGGSGGSGANRGTDGGQSSFGAHAVAAGGYGGEYAGALSSTTAGAGGDATVGDYLIGGQAGQMGGRVGHIGGTPAGTGGGGPFGGGGRGGVNGNSGSDGSDGKGPGAGGGGGYGKTAEGAQLGGTGADGLIIIELYGRIA